MKRHVRISLILFFALFWVAMVAYSQEEDVLEEESAAISLEDYTDEFQENFFEALKQKGIENYDKSANLLLKCKLLEPDNVVVDHELAKVYLANKQYILAQDHSLETLVIEPGNLWYLNTLVNIVQEQGSTLDALKDRFPYSNAKLKENLAVIYYKNKDYQNAVAVLKDMESSKFSKELLSKVQDSLKQIKSTAKQVVQENPPTRATSPFEQYKMELNALIGKADFKTVEKRAQEAVESFPSQPFFYYAYGLALNKNGNPKEAVGILETALDYLLDDDELADNIYKELANGYSAIGNTSKANLYLSKIKSGL